MDQEKAPSGPTLPASAPEHVPELDGVRGIAIVLVLLFHSAKGVVDFGWMGVDLFFVLSGYLITRGLAHARGQRHYFRDFYIKRALRIWPLYYLLVGFVYGVLPASSTGLDQPGAPPFWTFALYVQNLLAPGRAPGHLTATWSLAIEEQFYMVWPLAAALLSRRGLWRLSVGIVLLAPVLRWMVAATGTAPGVIYQLTYCRFDALAMGALLATARPLEPARLQRFSGLAALAGWGTAVPLGIAVGSTALSAMDAAGRPAVEAALFTLVALGSVGLVGLAVARVEGALGLLLRARSLRYLGKISYGIYIYHVPIFLLIANQVAARYPAQPPVAIKLLRVALELGITLAVASLSWRVLERPLLGLKAYLSERPAPAVSRSAVPAGAPDRRSRA
jgi:peptidoglycan/LPS O-acetylase OafA/YrhL